MEKKINHQLTPKLVDSIKKFAKKSAKIGSVAAVAAASSFTAADAGAVTITGGGSITENSDNTTSSLAVANGGGDTLVTANGATAITATLDGHEATKVASLISTSTGTGVLTLNVISTTTAGQDFSITGAVTVGASTDTDDTLIVNINTGDLIVGAAINETAANNVIDINIAAGRSLSATGNVDIEGDIDGIGAGNGIFIVGNASTTDVKESVGATAALAQVLVTDDTGAIFDKNITATLLSATGTTIVAGNVIANVQVLDNAFTHTVATGNKTITGTITEVSATSSALIFVNSANDAVIRTIVTGAVVVDAGEVGTANIGGALQLNSNSTITDLDILGGNNSAEASIVEIKGNLISATGISFDKNTGGAKLLASGTVAQIVTGVLDGIGAGEGTLQVTNTHASGVTFASAVGGTTLLLADIDTVATFNGALGAATINNAGTMIVTGAGVATAVISTGTSTFSSTLIAPTVTVSAGTATFNNKITASTGLIVSGASTVVTIAGAAPDMAELDITAATVKVNIKNSDVGAIDLNAAGVIEVGKNIVATEAVFIANAQAAAGFNTGGKIYMPITQSGGTAITILDGSGITAATAANLEAVLQDNALIDYVASKTGQDLIATANVKSALTVAGELKVTANEGKALAQAFDAIKGTGATEDIFFNALNARGGLTATDDSALAAAIAPQIDASSGSIGAARAMTGSVQGIVSNRMASLRSGDAHVSGMSAGNGMSANSAFVQGFKSEVEQDNQNTNTGTIFGYDAETDGFAIGFDGITESGSTVGLSASYSETSVTGLGVGKAKNDSDNYTVSVYADKSTDSGYIEGSLTYGISENIGSRKTNVVGIVRNYTSAYDSEQISLKVSAGSPNEVGDGTFVTPFGSLAVSMVEADKYTEKSDTAGDDLALTIDQESYTSMVGSAGLKLHRVTDMGTPMISLQVNQELGDSNINTVNSYVGGGTNFITTNDVEETSATLGLGYSFGSDMTSISIGYEGEANDAEYISHYGSVKLTSKF